MERLKISSFSICNGGTENFQANLLQKIDFSIGQAFYVTITDADITSLKSLHKLFDTYLDQFDQSRMVRK